ncbi:MAG TPA: CRISPR-associated helicase Cas3' [Gemmataceae bacterium]|nr:CRISPR-associated helicase Cas3' [Gemmataceae bacterium]
MTPDRLWAKSVKEGETPTRSHALPGHLEDVYRAARAVLVATADDQLRALDLGADYRPRLERCVLLAAACHDLGKCSSHFVGMLNKSKERLGKPQGLRHEWASLLLMLDLHDWLLPAVGGERDWQIALWAVGGHHPAYGRPSPPRLFVEGGGRTLTVCTGHPDFAACLDFLQRSFDLGPAPTLADQKWLLTGPDNVFEQLFRWYKSAAEIFNDLSLADRRFVAAVKNCLVGADVAGSALPHKLAEDAREVWIRDQLARRPTREQMDDLVQDRLTDEETGKVEELRDFQRQVARPEEMEKEVIFVKAGCGSGKTLAAYHWARTCCAGRRLYFCYPTTGTATEGFRDYLYNPDEKQAKFGAGLFHGKAWVDLKDMLVVKGDEAREEADAVARIESLDAWSTPIVSCTVDTVLGLVQNNRRGLYAWPALAGAAFVFDEIHAYDDRLFGALLRFIQALPGAPVLLMTASLPDARLQALRQCVQRRGQELFVVKGPADLEGRRRYRRLTTGGAAAAEVRAEIERGGKVLWVCNTVQRAMDAAASVADLQPNLYHSRFRYCDRKEQHNRVIKAFKADGAALACCTQVAEMSLDLSATLLVTELAPVPALIQRLGRLNRRAQKDDPKPFLVVKPMNDDGSPAVLPYTPQELEDADKWLTALAALGDGQLSQADLDRQWRENDKASRPEFVASSWLDGGPSTQVLELREASPGLTVVWDRDLEDLKSGKPAAEVAIPMPPPPRGMNWRNWHDFKGIPIVRSDLITYDPERGAQWGRS